ncbi:RBBP9/YdeN family alpha/beta hydrolase [Cupriavidus oxalaticus]|uniref:Alpha/beta hydrolase n=1 Tax=Cupriavidus oxalaticus TaxID=96344 RepID=A0A5P3VJY6_9BURK|nr:alpha/beta fold hydrolase [Cupriavidus oxalaticus]QEZ46550.1 alpha/beta hydrolase [Cupriavidus oxalaticus]
MTVIKPTVLIVPGLREHVPEHWQTLLAARLPRVVSVAPLEQDKLSCAARVEAIDRALAAIDGPVIIVAHSAGAMMVAHWAARGATREILGALLAAPADLETPMPAGYPTTEALDAQGWLPIPRGELPFPSIVAASSNDPLTRLDRARELAQAWGSRFVELGEVGHLNPASGYGEWPRAEAFIRELSQANLPTTARG